MKKTIFLVIVISMMAFSNPPDEIHGNDDFAFSIFRQMAVGSTENVFMSPLSIDMAFSMAANGATGNTFDQMADVLGFTGSITDVNADMKEIMSELDGADEKVTIKIANSLWGNETVEIKKGFRNVLKEYYDAHFENLNFVGKSAAKKINGWVKDRTEGMIDKVIETTTPDDLLVLVNAIYFDGEWSRKFKKEATYDAKFHAPEEDIELRMMSQRSNFKYSENNDVQAIEIPYGSGRFSAYVIMPENLGEYLNDFNRDSFNSMKSGLTMQEGYLHLPRFSMEYEKTLNEIMKDMGMTDAFDRGKAAFSSITDVYPCFISSAIHKAVLRVDEEGTEAAAVTAITFSTESVPPPPAFKMIVDHPFLWVMYDNTRDEVLFMGSVFEPAPLED